MVGFTNENHSALAARNAAPVGPSQSSVADTITQNVPNNAQQRDALQQIPHLRSDKRECWAVYYSLLKQQKTTTVHRVCVHACVRSQCLLSLKPFTLLPFSQHLKVHKYPEERGNMYRRNTGTNLPDYNHTTSTGHSSAMFLTNKPTVSEVSKRYLRY